MNEVDIKKIRESHVLLITFFYSIAKDNTEILPMLLTDKDYLKIIFCV